MTGKLFGAVSVYGLLIACGIMLAVLLCGREAKRLCLPPDTGIDMVLWAIPAAVIGARIYYVIFRWDVYSLSPVRILYIWEGGLAIYGGVIGGLIGLAVYARRSRIRLFRLLDIAAPALILGQAIGRWGNFFNGEAYGRIVRSSFWQFFPVAVFADGDWHLATFFYESVWDLAGFALLWRCRKRTLHKGDVFLLYLLWYGAGRAVIEELRADSLMLGPLRVSQVLSVLLCTASAAVLLIRKNRPEDRPDKTDRGEGS